MNAFTRLGLEERLQLSEDEVREAFRRMASREHPDSGGDEAAFSELQNARECLLSPARRLKEWVGCQGMEVEDRGQIDSGLIELFEEVSKLASEAEKVIRESDLAQATLVKAMVEVKLITQRDRIKDLLAKIGAAIEMRISLFSEIENEVRDAGPVIRDLAFLEKWRSAMKGVYARLV